MQKRNSYNNLEDFLSDISFQKWVRHNIDSQNWETWIIENPERAKLVEEARGVLLAMKVEEPLVSNQEIQIALQNTWKKINNLENTKSKSSIFELKWYKYAASILVIGVASLVYFLFQKQTSSSSISYKELIEQNSDGLIEQTNNTDKPQLINLSDASSVLLQPNSKLSYPKIFTNNERKVFLSGEGFFEIRKDKKRPFFVYANEIVTKVYGTSFRVIAYSNQPNVEVLVRTGKVKVSSNKELKNKSIEEVTLLPNQAARFVRKELTLIKISDITQDIPLLKSTSTIEQLSFEFNDTPVSQIFKTIEQGYLVQIIFPELKLNQCYLTTSLTDEPLPEKLKIICESLGKNTRYEMNGNQITIFSNGCN